MFQTYLSPFFTRNEANINASIAAAQANIITFLQTRVTMLWDAVLHNVSQAAANAAPQNGQPGAQPPAAGSPAGFLQGLWNSYGPTAMGALQQYAQAAQSTSAMAANIPPAASPAHPATPAANGEPAAPPFPEPKIY